MWPQTSCIGLDGTHMMSALLTRRLALVAGGAAIVGMGALTAGCSSSTKEAPTSTTPSATSSAPATSSAEATPTEKRVDPKPIPSFEDRAGSDSHSCGPGRVKVNGTCQ